MKIQGLLNCYSRKHLSVSNVRISRVQVERKKLNRVYCVHIDNGECVTFPSYYSAEHYFDLIHKLLPDQLIHFYSYPSQDKHFIGFKYYYSYGGVKKSVVKSTPIFFEKEKKENNELIWDFDFFNS